MAKVRLKTECIGCGRTYSKLIDDEDREGTVKLVCPFCSYESKVEFVDRSIKYLYRGGSKEFRLDEIIRLPKRSETMKTNFMVFIAGDNNLDRAGQGDIQEMLAVEETGDKLNIIVQYDQSKESKSSTTKRYVIQDGKKVFEKDIGETNTGDVNTLTEFLNWGITDYPADRNIVILWNHGGGTSDDLPAYYNNITTLSKSINRVKVSKTSGAIQAISPNSTLGDEPSLFPQLVRQGRIKGFMEKYQGLKDIADDAVKSILLDDESKDFIDNIELKEVFTTYSKKIDIIGFDACLMSMMEVVYQLRDHSEIIVGSEENEPGDGWDYKAIVSYIVENPNASNDAISKKIIESYIDSYGHLNGKTKLTLSSIRTDKLKSVVSLMDDFARTILDNESKIFKTLRDIVDEVEYFNNDDLYFDLYHFVALSREYYSQEDSYQEEIKESADRLLEELKDLIIDNQTVKLKNAHGVSVYLGTNAKMSSLAFGIFSELDINTEAPNWFELFKKMNKRLRRG